MDTFIIYTIKSAIYFTVFYVCIKAFLSNETFFRFNRWVILVGTTACLLLPLAKIKVETDSVPVIQAPIMMLEKTLSETVFEPAPPIITEVQEANPVAQNVGNTTYISIGMVILAVYLAGLLISFFFLFRSTLLMTSLIRKGKKQTYSNYILVLISQDIVPFSWGRYIVMSVSDYQSNPQEIITHEIAHTKHHHSIDIIFMELVLLLQWFNPAMWLLKKELKDIHEYQADISVLQSGIDATKYQLLLVKKAVGASSYTLANSFNHSKIKKRITMMLKIRSNKWARLKLLLLLPLGTLTVFAFARPEVNEPLSSLVEYESTNILSDTKISEKGNVGSVPSIMHSDTTPKKKTVKFTPPMVKKDDPKNTQKKKETPPPPPPLRDKKKEAGKKDVEIEDVEGRKAAEKKAYTPPPPPIKKGNVIIVEDVEGKKKAKKKTDTPPPPPPIKKKGTDKKDVEIEDVEGRKAAGTNTPKYTIKHTPVTNTKKTNKSSKPVIVKDE